MELQFKSGDILLFEAEDVNNFIEKCIMKLTDSNITHSAMVYKDNTMVEMIASGISLTPFHCSEKGVKTHALRFTPQMSPKPLINAADVYLKSKIKYDYADLILLAGLLIFKKLNLTTVMSEIVFAVLQLACQFLDEIYQRFENKGKRIDMICSQLVYQIYYDCGPDYLIKIRNGLLQQDNGKGIRIYDYISHSPKAVHKSLDQQYCKKEYTEIDSNSLAKELFGTLSEQKNVNLSKKTTQFIDVKTHCVKDQAEEFIGKIEQLLTVMKINLPLPALFVTPSDLLNNTENLIQYGTASIAIDNKNLNK